MDDEKQLYELINGGNKTFLIYAADLAKAADIFTSHIDKEIKDVGLTGPDLRDYEYAIKCSKKIVSIRIVEDKILILQ